MGSTPAKPHLDRLSEGGERQEIENVSKFIVLTKNVVLPHSQPHPNSSKAETQMIKENQSHSSISLIFTTKELETIVFFQLTFKFGVTFKT